MSRFFDLVSQPAREMGMMDAARATPAAVERRSQLIKLDSNENPFGPSPRAIDAMRSALATAAITAASPKFNASSTALRSCNSLAFFRKL